MSKRGDKIRIKGITDIGDTDLNGMVGTLTKRHPWIPECAIRADVGIVIEQERGPNIFANLKHGEYEKVED